MQLHELEKEEAETKKNQYLLIMNLKSSVAIRRRRFLKHNRPWLHVLIVKKGKHVEAMNEMKMTSSSGDIEAKTRCWNEWRACSSLRYAAHDTIRQGEG